MLEQFEQYEIENQTVIFGGYVDQPGTPFLRITQPSTPREPF